MYYSCTIAAGQVSRLTLRGEIELSVLSFKLPQPIDEFPPIGRAVAMLVAQFDVGPIESIALDIDDVVNVVAILGAI